MFVSAVVLRQRILARKKYADVAKRYGSAEGAGTQ